MSKLRAHFACPEVDGLAPAVAWERADRLAENPLRRVEAAQSGSSPRSTIVSRKTSEITSWPLVL